MRDLGPNKIRRHAWSKRRGLPTITGAMLEVLIQLRIAHDLDEPYIDLDGVDQRTVQALLVRMWIGKRGVKYVDYMITDAGLSALKIYEPQLKRKDGLCPECGVRPKHVTRSGAKRAIVSLA
jgi:hypothetical protein